MKKELNDLHNENISLTSFFSFTCFFFQKYKEKKNKKSIRKFIFRYIKFQCDLMWHEGERGGKEKVATANKRGENGKKLELSSFFPYVCAYM